MGDLLVSGRVFPNGFPWEGFSSLAPATPDVFVGGVNPTEENPKVFTDLHSRGLPFCRLTWRCGLCPSKIEWDRIPTDPVQEVAIELLDTQVFSGSVQWVRPLEISWIYVVLMMMIETIEICRFKKKTSKMSAELA